MAERYRVLNYVEDIGRVYQLAVHSEPSMHSSTVANVPAGTVLTHAGNAPVPTDDGRVWIYVQTPSGTIGWVSKRVIERVTEEANWLAAALERAKTAIGAQYVWGGESWKEGGFDCSGLVYWAYNTDAQGIPRTAQEQYDATTRIGEDDLQPGDLVFYTQTYDAGVPVTHVAIYMTDHRVLMSSESRGVTYAALDDPSYGPKIYGYGRV